VGRGVVGEPLLCEANVVDVPTCAIGAAARQLKSTVVGPIPVTVMLGPSHETDIVVLGVI
jgi:hypothetical protein